MGSVGFGVEFVYFAFGDWVDGEGILFHRVYFDSSSGIPSFACVLRTISTSLFLQTIVSFE